MTLHRRPAVPGRWPAARQIYLFVLALGAVFALVGCGPLFDPDTLQDRAKVPAQRLSSGHTIGQTFVARQAGLTALDLLIVAYPDTEPAADQGDLILHLRASPDSSTDIATSRVPLESLANNSYRRFLFAPQPNSASRPYYLLVEATSTVPARVTAWSSGADVYPPGTSYADGQPTSGDLAFRLYYDYGPTELVSDLTQRVPRQLGSLAIALLLLILPGAVLQQALAPAVDLDPAERAGLWLGLSLATAPLLLLFTTLAGIRLGATTIGGLLVVLAGAAGWQAIVARRSRPVGGLRGKSPGGPAARPPGGSSPVSRSKGDFEDRLDSSPGSGEPAVEGTQSADGTEHSIGRPKAQLPLAALGAFAATAAAGLLRLVHARDLALPMWGDSVHHTLISRLIAESGQVPATYGPTLPPETFDYHFGFHTIVAYLYWLVGPALTSAVGNVPAAPSLPGLDLASGVLFVGQLLSALVVLPTYLLASRLAGDRRAGLVAGVIVGLVSLMPTYSITWGRYPQLAGLAVLPAAAYFVGRVLDGSAARLGEVVLGSLAAAGLVLNHPRVALFFGCWVIARIIVSLPALASRLRRDWHEGALQALAPAWRLAGLAMLASLLVAPWLARLATTRQAQSMTADAVATAFIFPLSLLTVGADRYVLAAAIAGAAFSALARKRAGLEIVLWVTFGLGAANPRLIGLPISLHLTDDALAISLFLPIAVLVGLLASTTIELGGLAAWPRALRTGGGAALAVIGVLGATSLIPVVNPACVLATTADVEALRWVAANTPADAAFLVNSFDWQRGIYMGTDGGYWIGALTGRRASVPPLVYDEAAPAETARVRDLAKATQADPLDPVALRSRLIAEGYGYVYIGARGGTLSAETFSGVPGYRLVYSNDRARIFAVEPAD